MPAKRIIPCLDVKGGRVVKGVNFLNLRDAGDPVEAAARYDAQGADEVTYLDIAATLENRGTLLDLVSRTAACVFAPAHRGRRRAQRGGLRGAAPRRRRQGERQLVGGRRPGAGGPALGRRRRTGAGGGGRREAPPGDAPHRVGGPRGRRLEAHRAGRASPGFARWRAAAPARSCSPAWTGTGPAPATTWSCSSGSAPRWTCRSSPPAGVGTLEHLAEGLRIADAALAASIFHDGQYTVGEAKRYLAERGIEVRP